MDGLLCLYDVGQLRQLTHDEPARRTLIGGGWNAYDQIVRRSTGLVACDKDGVLWSYEGKDGGTLTPPASASAGAGTSTPSSPAAPTSPATATKTSRT
ncbi:hypothetical protein [Streptomyces narbonensis]|uniref:hypothetical protein n=1 Tax=Streptomyces narbonensis TaxID=67333 RepID=UPI00340720FA